MIFRKMVSAKGSVVMPRLLGSAAARICAHAISGLAAIGLLTGSAQGQNLTLQTISAGQALKIVTAAIAKCSVPGPKITISVAVVDQAGNSRLLLNADTASPHNFDLARRKAYTARTFRMPSSEWAKASSGNTPQAAQRQMNGVIALGGGVPIVVKGEVIGGVGISGAMGDQPAEEVCARAAADSIAGELQ
jgi:uncharacterized protein GlcG (DUF336 family)